MAVNAEANVYDLFLPVLQNYAQDPGIFSKALQITKAYQDRTDFPFMFDQFNEATEAVLGIGVPDMSQAAGLFRAGVLRTDVASASEANRQAVEAVDEHVRARFVNELKAFSLTLSDLMTKFYSGNLIPATPSLDRVLVVESASGGEGSHHVVRLIRTDGEYLDMALTPKAAKFVAETLNMIADGKQA